MRSLGALILVVIGGCAVTSPAGTDFPAASIAIDAAPSTAASPTAEPSPSAPADLACSVVVDPSVDMFASQAFTLDDRTGLAETCEVRGGEAGADADLSATPDADGLLLFSWADGVCGDRRLRLTNSARGFDLEVIEIEPTTEATSSPIECPAILVNRTAAIRVKAAQVSCPAAHLDGRLERRHDELVAVNGEETAVLTWEPTQYRVRERGGVLLVEDMSGAVVANEGDVVTISGGFVGDDDRWLVCGGVFVRGPQQEPTPGGTSAEATPSPFQPSADLEVVDFGFSTYQDVYDDGESSVSWAVVVRNPNTNALARHVRVVVNLLDNSGATVQSARPKWGLILPGQSVAYADELGVKVSGTLHTITVMEVEIVDNSPWEPVFDLGGEFSFSNVSSVRDEIGGIRTTASLTSSFQDDTSAVVVVIYRNGDAIVGGANTFVDRVPAGGQRRVNVDGPRGLGTFDDSELFAHLSLPSRLLTVRQSPSSRNT